MVVLVAEDNNVALGLNWVAILVLFDYQDTHARDGRAVLFGQVVVFRCGDRCEDFMIKEALVFLSV